MLWDAVQSALAAALPAGEYELWIKPIACVAEDDEGFLLSGPDRFFCAWVEQRYFALIREKCLEAGGGGLLRFQDGSASRPVTIAGRPGQQLRLPGAPVRNAQIRSLHPAFTFDQFMVGESNILARSACKALAKGDDSFGRCLFMDGATGLGKSHLTQAVVHQVLRDAPATRLRYLSAQQFGAEMVKSLKEKSMDRFADRYIDDCDMLLLEDVHCLGGRRKTQEELNVVLDYLLKSGRRVILTSSLPPDRIEGLDADLKSRMASGLLAGIRPPAFETRVRIIRRKMELQGLIADDAVVECLAENLQGDVRRMESAVMSLKARCRLTQAPPDLALAREVLGDCGPEAPAPLEAEAICALVGARFKVSAEDLRSRSRKRGVVFPRQLAIYLTRKFTGHSLTEIGEMYDRDHSTVLHAIRAVTQKMTQNTAVREQVGLLERSLQKTV